jgi:hypothetical protein
VSDDLHGFVVNEGGGNQREVQDVRDDPFFKQRLHILLAML